MICPICESLRRELRNNKASLGLKTMSGRLPIIGLTISGIFNERSPDDLNGTRSLNSYGIALDNLLNYKISCICEVKLCNS